MTDTTEPAGGRAVLSYLGASHPRAFAAAGRHSRRVRFFRRAIVAVCTGAVGIIGFVSVFDPFHRFKMGLSVGSVGLSGTRITMRDPKLSGTRKDGYPYEVKAATASQDTAGPNVVDLTEVDVRLGQPDGSTTLVTARTGRFDPDRDRLDLAGSVRFLNQGRYDMSLEQAAVEMREGRIVTDRPAVVILPDGRFEADALTMTEGTQTVVMEGRVRSVFSGEASP